MTGNDRFTGPDGSGVTPEAGGYPAGASVPDSDRPGIRKNRSLPYSEEEIQRNAVTHAPDSKHDQSGSEDSPDSARGIVSPERAIDRITVFEEGKKVDRAFTLQEAIDLAENNEHTFVWLSLISPSPAQMVPIAEKFGLHSLTVEDIVQANQRPKLEIIGDYIFIVARTVQYDPAPPDSTSQFIETNEVHVLIGPEFVITIRHGDQPITSLVRRRVEDSPQLVSTGPSSIAYALLDWIVDDYLRISEELENKVEAQENEVFTPNNSAYVEPIYMLKRENLEMRHAIDPLTPVLKTLSSSKQVSGKALRSLYRDVLDHQITAADRVSSYDERLSTLIDAAVAKVTIQQNTDMRKISAWACMAVVPTMIAGIYGMNFENMPELQWHYGYFDVLIFMFLICTFLWFVFRKNNWL